MQPTRVVLETERRTTSLEEGYVDVSDEELATLLRLCHDTAESLKAEMKTRQLRIPNFIPENSSQFYNALDKAARRFKVVDRVDNRASKHVDTAITILTQVQTNRSGQVYQEFLHDVLRHSSPGVVMLCAVAFGKQKLANMREDERMNILDVVRVKGGSLQSPSLDVLADDYGVPSLDSPQIVPISGMRKRKRRMTLQPEFQEFYGMNVDEMNSTDQFNLSLSHSSASTVRQQSAIGQERETFVETQTMQTPRRKHDPKVTLKTKPKRLQT